MANQPHPDTVTVSFTLPRELAASVTKHARSNMTTKSDIIRRALLRYIPADEAADIIRSVMHDEPSDTPISKQKPVNYAAKKPTKKKPKL